jgi:hypothetical protein
MSRVNLRVWGEGVYTGRDVYILLMKPRVALASVVFFGFVFLASAVHAEEQKKTCTTNAIGVVKCK